MRTVHRVVHVTMSQTEETYALEDELVQAHRMGRECRVTNTFVICLSITIVIITIIIIIIIIIVVINIIIITTAAITTVIVIVLALSALRSPNTLVLRNWAAKLHGRRCYSLTPVSSGF